VRERRNGIVIYLTLLLGGVGLFLLIRAYGETLGSPEASPAVSTTDAAATATRTPPQSDLILHVIATLAAVVGLGYLLGRVCSYVGQPPVIGEVIAGIMLGPSLLGVISPEAMHFLIPLPSADPRGQVLAALKAISQLGVILYMFLVGLELNAAQLRGRVHSAIAVSHASIVIPFVLGSLISLWLYPSFTRREVSFTSFALFMGVAMSVTAFPVLARILTDRGIEKTSLGVVALACAAADDMTAWCLLALVVGVVQAKLGGVAVTAALTGAYIGLMFLFVRPLLARAMRLLDARAGALPPAAVYGTYVLLLLSALATEAIGIHAIFGGFLLGAMIPHESRVARDFSSKLKDPVTVLMLPAFFAFTGMRTEISLLNEPAHWLICAVIVLMATLGKFGGTYCAARLTGYANRESAALGILMNTRGLMELIVLNIGLDLGVLSPTLFTMMVLMALITTIATAPILKLIFPNNSWLEHTPPDQPS